MVMATKEYLPKPMDTSCVELDPSLKKLAEAMARNTHDVWAAGRMKEGWKYGPMRDDILKTHPCLIPYEHLPESEKEYDRMTSLSTLKFIVASGYDIMKK